MTLYQFNELDENTQAEMVWDKGVYSGDRRDEVHNILLYQLHGFYVEVYFHRNQNEIKRLRSFSRNFLRSSIKRQRPSGATRSVKNL